jgi:branched-chain amino acid transport system permease protein
MTTVLQLTIAGLALGCIYALVASGFTVIYRATGVANFAQGSLVTFGAYVGFALLVSWNWPPLVAVLGVVVAGAGAGLFLYFTAFRPFIGADQLTILVGTFAVAWIITGLIGVIAGPKDMAVPSLVGDGAIHLGRVDISNQDLLVVAVTAVIVIAQYWTFQRTTLGAQFRALASDPVAAELVGIRRKRISAMIFAIGASEAAIAGVLLAPLLGVRLALGFQILLVALVASVIGGFSSQTGALIGGIVLGVVETVGAYYLPSGWAPALPTMVMLLVLITRPEGLIPDRVRARA